MIMQLNDHLQDCWIRMCLFSVKVVRKCQFASSGVSRTCSNHPINTVWQMRWHASSHELFPFVFAISPLIEADFRVQYTELYTALLVSFMCFTQFPFLRFTWGFVPWHESSGVLQSSSDRWQGNVYFPQSILDLCRAVITEKIFLFIQTVNHLPHVGFCTWNNIGNDSQLPKKYLVASCPVSLKVT